MSSGKRPGTSVAASETAVVLLIPNDSDGGGNFHSGWLAYAKGIAAKQDADLSLHLTFLDTNERYIAPLPDRATIIAENTRPAVPAGPFGVPAAIAAVPPSEALVNHLEQDCFVRRQKVMTNVNSSGTRAWNLLQSISSHASWTTIETDFRFRAADESPIKDAFVLFQIIRATHAVGAVGSIGITSHERQRIKDDFEAFQQGNLDVNDYHKAFTQWIKRRQAAGITDLTESEQVACFYSKLNSRKYGELVRERENEEKKLILRNMPVPQMTLALALSDVRSYKPTPGAKYDDNPKKSLNVFALESKPDEDDLKMACEVLASAVPGASSHSVFLALKNANFGAGGSGSKSAAKNSSNCPPLMVAGRPWTRECAVPGCNQKHPFYLHEAMTGKPPDAESQAKIDAFAAKKLQNKKSEAKDSRVLVAKGDSDDDDVNHYFIGAVDAHLDVEGDDDEECVYSPNTYSVLISTTPANNPHTGSTWTGGLTMLICVAITLSVSYLSVWCLVLVGYVGNLLFTEQLHILATRVRHPQPSPFDNEQLLFDNQAGISMVKNIDALIHVQQLPSRRVISGIAGDASAIIAESDGELPGLPGVRFLVAPNASANILAECDARNAGWTVSLDDGVYMVSTPEARLEFRIMPGWHAHPACVLPTSAAALVTTVAGNLSKFSAAEQAYATKARQLQNRMGLPCDDYMISGLSGIDNAGVSPADVRRATAIAGPPVAKVRGGTTQKATPAQRIEAEMPRTTPVPLTMEIDIFFCVGIIQSRY